MPLVRFGLAKLTDHPASPPKNSTRGILSPCKTNLQALFESKQIARFRACAFPSAMQGVDQFSPPTVSRQEHNSFQVEYFTREMKALQDSITPEVEEQLKKVAGEVPFLGSSSRVLDVGAGDGALIPHLQNRGVQEIVAVDVCPTMIEALHTRIGSPPSVLGNDPCVRTWVGDIIDLPAYYGPFDAAFFNAVFGNFHDQRAALLHVAMMVRPGGWIVISHPLGRNWLESYAYDNPRVVPHRLPCKEELADLIHDLPLQLVSFHDDFLNYTVRLKVPEGFSHNAAPIHLGAKVVTGFGRGSKQLGIPTANLEPGALEDELQNLPAGVYFGWAKLDAEPGSPIEDFDVHKMVMNIGRRPTFEDKEPEISVEVHIMHKYAAEDFHGRQLRVVALGFLRPEFKFSGVAQLLERIRTDIGIAKSQLDTKPWQPFKRDTFFKTFD